MDKITTSVLYFSDLNNIDPRLVVATIIAESDFDLYSTSRAGAMGLAQIMPDEARSLGVTNAYDPIQNIGAAVHLLRGPSGQIRRRSLQRRHYSLQPDRADHGRLQRRAGRSPQISRRPPYRETQRYIKRITALYRQMCGLSQQASAQ